MIVRARSTVTLVRGGGGVPSIAACSSSQSPSASRAGKAKRRLAWFSVAPRPPILAMSHENIS